MADIAYIANLQMLAQQHALSCETSDSITFDGKHESRNHENQKDEFDDDVMIEGPCTLAEDNSWLLKPWAKKAKPLPNSEF